MKERLTGAIILVALIVLLVPELLTGPIRAKPAPAAGEKIAGGTAGAARPSVSSADGGPPLRSYTLALTDGTGGEVAKARASTDTQAPPGPQAQREAEAAAGQEAASGQLPSAAVVQSAHAVPPPAPAPSMPNPRAPARVAASTPRQLPRGTLREARSSGEWVVQLGSFASHENAAHLARVLRARGFPVSVSPARAGSRTLWRVRAGPAHDRAGAARLAARLRALGQRGELLPAG